jgi:hypothetical protein
MQRVLGFAGGSHAGGGWPSVAGSRGSSPLGKPGLLCHRCTIYTLLQFTLLHETKGHMH